MVTYDRKPGRPIGQYLQLWIPKSPKAVDKGARFYRAGNSSYSRVTIYNVKVINLSQDDSCYT